MTVTLYPRAFGFADANRDGKLTAGELGPKALAKMDKDKNGAVSIEEYSAHRQEIVDAYQKSGAEFWSEENWNFIYHDGSHAAETKRLSDLMGASDLGNEFYELDRTKKERSLGRFIGAWALTIFLFPLKLLLIGALVAMEEAAWGEMWPKRGTQEAVDTAEANLAAARAALPDAWEAFESQALPAPR
jgi:hypothetical protein